MTIWPLERGELLCLENVAFISPFLVHYLSNISENAIIRNSKSTGDMLSPCLNSTLYGMDVSISPIISLTTLFHKLF